MAWNIKIYLNFKERVFLCLALFALLSPLQAQKKNKSIKSDTLRIKGGTYIRLGERIIKPKQDTTIVLNGKSEFEVISDKRTQAFYDSLEASMSNSKLKKTLYDLLIVKSAEQQEEKDFEATVNGFLPYEGMRIGSVRIKRVDIIEGSVYDTSIVASTWLGKTANRIQADIRDKAINRMLLFKAGESIDPYKLSDTERILRSYDFIEDAKIMVGPDGQNPEVMHIIVVLKEVFSIGVEGSVDGIDNFNVRIYDRNFLGLAHQWSNRFFFNNSDQQKFGYEGDLVFNNILAPFVTASFNYTERDQFDRTRLKLERPFVSPEIKYLWGVEFNNVRQVRTEEVNDTAELEMPYRQEHWEAWGERIFDIGTAKNRIMFGVAGSYENDRFTSRPEVESDTNFFFHNGQTWLGAVSLRKYKYREVRKVLGFGRTEDIIEGYSLRLTGGMQNGEFENRPYYRLDLGSAGYFQGLGYGGLSWNIGAFRNRGRWEDGISRVTGLLFTELIHLKKYQIRPIFRLDWRIAVDRLISDQEYELSDLLPGYEEDRPRGDRFFSLSAEPVIFTPWLLYGFRFVVFGATELTWIGDKDNVFDNDVYAGFGLGVRIRNESLVFNTLELRVDFLPRVFQSSAQFNFEFSGSDRRLVRTIMVTKPDVIDFVGN